MKKTIANSIKTSFKLIRKHKLLFAGLVFIQLVFVSVLFSVQNYYWVRIMEDGVNVLDYMQEQKLDEEGLGESILFQKNVMGDDPLMVYRRVKNMTKNFIFDILATMCLFIIFSGISWSLTDHFINKKSYKHFVAFYYKFFVVSLAYLIGLLVFLFLLMRSMIGEDQLSFSGASYIVVGVMLLVVALMVVSFALVSQSKFKDIFRNSIKVIKKSYLVILVTLLINSVVIGILSYLVYLVLELNIVLLLVTIVLLLSAIVLARLFFLIVIDKLYD